MLPSSVLCLGVSAECAPLIIDSYFHGFNTVAFGLDTAPCIDELYNLPEYKGLENKLIPLNFDLVDIVVMEDKEEILDFITKSFKNKGYEVVIEKGKIIDKKSNEELFFVGFIKADIRLVDEAKIVANLFNVSCILPAPIGYLIKTVGILNDSLNLPGVSEQTALNFSDKKRVRDLLISHNCNCAAQLCLFEDEIINSDSYDKESVYSFMQNERLKRFIAEQNFPLVLKPRFGSGSRHVSVVFNTQELFAALFDIKWRIESKRLVAKQFKEYDALKDTIAAMDGGVAFEGYMLDTLVPGSSEVNKVDTVERKDYSQQNRFEFSPPPFRQDLFCYDMLVEDYIEHDYEFTFNAVLMNGKVITCVPLDKIRMSPFPHRQEMAYYNTPIEPAVFDVLVSEIERAAQTLGILNSALLADVILSKDKKKAYVVDIAGRHTGYYIHRVFNKMGNNLMDAFFDYVVADFNAKKHNDPSWIKADRISPEALLEKSKELFTKHTFLQHFFKINTGTLNYVPTYDDLVKVIEDVLKCSHEEAKEHALYFKCKLRHDDVIGNSFMQDGGLTNAGFILLKDVSKDDGLTICDKFFDLFTYKLNL